MASYTPVPVFDGKPENFNAYRQEVELWLLMTHLPTGRRAPALALAMDRIPRELCMALGTATLTSDEGVEKLMET